MSNRTVRRLSVPLLGFYGFVALLWLLALASHLSGSPTAVNALVGIPIGALLISPLFWALGP